MVYNRIFKLNGLPHGTKATHTLLCYCNDKLTPRALVTKKSTIASPEGTGKHMLSHWDFCRNFTTNPANLVFARAVEKVAYSCSCVSLLEARNQMNSLQQHTRRYLNFESGVCAVLHICVCKYAKEYNNRKF